MHDAPLHEIVSIALRRGPCAVWTEHTVLHASHAFYGPTHEGRSNHARLHLQSSTEAVMGRNTLKCISNKDKNTDTSKYFK